MSRLLPRANIGFRHEACFYAGDEEFLDRAEKFVRDGIESDEPTLVVVASEKIDALRTRLSRDANKVRFADMAEIGCNPARIIPVWKDFVVANSGSFGHYRGIGEPIWAGRSHDELIESQLHETLLNLAFDASQDFWLLCPYDIKSLEPPIIEEALRSHPFFWENDSHSTSAAYKDSTLIDNLFDLPLKDPPPGSEIIRFGPDDLDAIRQLVMHEAISAKLESNRAEDLVLAVNEVVTNSLRYAGGSGILRVWLTKERLMAEVEDRGFIDTPLAGRERPSLTQDGGFGLWLVNQICDLVQIRATAAGTIVRMQMRRD